MKLREKSKVENRVYCKKALSNKEIAYGFGGKVPRLIKGEWYNVKYVEEVQENIYLTIADVHFWYDGDGKSMVSHSKMFEDYFYTGKELRKLKLDEIESR